MARACAYLAAITVLLFPENLMRKGSMDHHFRGRFQILLSTIFLEPNTRQRRRLIARILDGQRARAVRVRTYA